MGHSVFANGMGVSGKAAGHNVIAAMPDVCLSPPSPPAGPIPIPYPNFAQASDTTDGSKKVKAGGKEINLKGQSKYKSCKGDEACTKTFGMGVVSHSNTGATKHEAGSFDVKVEGSGVVRHLDLTTSNHSNPTNGSMTVDIEAMSPGMAKTECKALSDTNKARREEIDSKTSNKSAIGKDGEGKGTTVSSMKAHNRGGTGGTTTSAHNNKVAQEFCPSSLVKGGNDKVRSGEETPLCGKSDYKHPAPASQKSGHAEARLMADMAQSPPKAALINIDWKPGAGGSSKMPCPDCHKMLCAAAKDCGHKIYLCDKEGKAQDIADTCPKEEDAPGEGYDNLKKKMGEFDAG